MDRTDLENNTESKITRVFLFGPLIVVVLFFVIQIIPFHNLSNKQALESEQSQKVVINKDIPLEKVAEKENVKIIAQSSIVKNLRTGEVIYSKNENDPLPLASLTKIMTALVATLSLNDADMIAISPSDLATEGTDSLNEGEKWGFKNLRDFMLVSSSNDSASALASVAGANLKKDNPGLDTKTLFISEMNNISEKIGLLNTHFYNETGLDQHGRAGAFGSANDVAKLFEYVFENHPLILEPTKEESLYSTSESGFQHIVYNTNTIIGDLPNLIASKTGYTEEAGGNLAVIVDAGLSDPIIIVVLGSTIDGRFEDVQTLANQFVIKDITDN